MRSSTGVVTLRRLIAKRTKMKCLKMKKWWWSLEMKRNSGVGSDVQEIGLAEKERAASDGEVLVN